MGNLQSRLYGQEAAGISLPVLRQTSKTDHFFVGAIGHSQQVEWHEKNKRK